MDAFLFSDLSTRNPGVADINTKREKEAWNKAGAKEEVYIRKEMYTGMKTNIQQIPNHRADASQK